MPTLLSLKDLKPIKVGDSVLTFRGQKAVVKDIIPPGPSSPLGQVIIELVGVKNSKTCFPSIINATIRPSEDELPLIGIHTSNPRSKWLVS